MRAALLACGPGDIAKRISRANAVCQNRFTFLNVSQDLAKIPWSDTPVSHLWSFNLHYFDYAVDLAWAFEETRNQRYLVRLDALVTDWERETGAGSGDAWNPYVVSVRAINWSYVLLLSRDSLTPDFRRRLTDSLHRQVAFLSNRLEWHILGNHLLRNLQAIALAGLLFEGDEARSWREVRTAQLWLEMREQVLPDGGHFERSPMYHAIVLGDLLELLALRTRCGLATPASVVDVAQKMLVALIYMSREDGGLRLFNDSAHGIAPTVSYLSQLARVVSLSFSEVDRKRWELPNTGYFGAREGKFELILDCGPIGASYQPGHAHCDILSYELDYDDTRFVVDSGVSGYEDDPFREYSRSTRGHNTLMIDGKEQSELWGNFRVARRAEVIEARYEPKSAPDLFVFNGAYRPYQPRGASHYRSFRLTPSHLQVLDAIHGADGASVLSVVHLHPDCRVEAIEQGFRISRSDRTLKLVPVGFDSARVVRGATRPAQGWFLPEFGKCIASVALELGIAHHDGREFGYTISAE
jgi:uncharacterized heparinase superfamily protein